MDPRKKCLVEALLRLPRASGGWTRIPCERAPGQPGCPARAGMDPGQQRHHPLRPGLPRASGDGPTAASYGLGTTSGCPARAGMDPLCAIGTSGKAWLPRASGDGPQMFGERAREGQAAPRERGWTLRRGQSDVHWRGCPARAGMDPALWIATPQAHGLPRASGDGPVGAVALKTLTLAAPRERGWTLDVRARTATRLGCPARAGMDPRR